MAVKFGAGILDRVKSKTLDDELHYHQVSAHDCWKRIDRIMANGGDTTSIGRCLQYIKYHEEWIQGLLGLKYSGK